MSDGYPRYPRLIDNAAPAPAPRQRHSSDRQFQTSGSDMEVFKKDAQAPSCCASIPSKFRTS
eukprot:1187613-Prorocentrum_minimum.AAC.3